MSRNHQILHMTRIRKGQGFDGSDGAGEDNLLQSVQTEERTIAHRRQALRQDNLTSTCHMVNVLIRIHGDRRRTQSIQRSNLNTIHLIRNGHHVLVTVIGIQRTILGHVVQVLILLKSGDTAGGIRLIHMLDAIHIGVVVLQHHRHIELPNLVGGTVDMNVSVLIDLVKIRISTQTVDAGSGVSEIT